MPLTQAQHRQLRQLGDAVRRERVRAGWTQEQLAEKTELNPRTIQKIEAGSLNLLITTVARLQTALECPWTSLLGPDRRRRS